MVEKPPDKWLAVVIEQLLLYVRAHVESIKAYSNAVPDIFLLHVVNLIQVGQAIPVVLHR